MGAVITVLAPEGGVDASRMGVYEFQAQLVFCQAVLY